MKILMVNNLASKHGGAETMVAQLKRGLERQGHSVRIMAGSEKGNGENIADVTFRTFPSNSKILRLMYIFNPFAYAALWRELRTFKPDIVHLHLFSKASPFILNLLGDYPTVLTVHDHTLFDPTRIQDVPLLRKSRLAFGDYFISKPSVRFYLEKLRFYVLRRFSHNIDLVLACSGFYADCAKSSGIFSKIKILHNGIFLRPYAAWENTKKILFIGRLSEDKGASVLIDAAVQLVLSHPDARIDIVGAGSQMKALRQKVADLDLGKTVAIRGHRSAAEITRLYQEAAIVIVPSIVPDNLPTVCIEAMAVGRPVIASRTGGLPELVENGKTGLLVPPSDPDALSDSIHLLLSDPRLMARMGLAGRKKAEKEFNGDIYIKKTLLEYENLRKSYKKI